MKKTKKNQLVISTPAIAVTSMTHKKDNTIICAKLHFEVNVSEQVVQLLNILYTILQEDTFNTGLILYATSQCRNESFYLFSNNTKKKNPLIPL